MDHPHPFLRRFNARLCDETRSQKVFENKPEARHHAGIKQEEYCEADIENIHVFQRAVEVVLLLVGVLPLRQAAKVSPRLLHFGVGLDILLDFRNLRTIGIRVALFDPPVPTSATSAWIRRCPLEQNRTSFLGHAALQLSCLRPYSLSVGLGGSLQSVLASESGRNDGERITINMYTSQSVDTDRSIDNSKNSWILCSSERPTRNIRSVNSSKIAPTKKLNEIHEHFCRKNLAPSHAYLYVENDCLTRETHQLRHKSTDFTTAPLQKNSIAANPLNCAAKESNLPEDR